MATNPYFAVPLVYNFFVGGIIVMADLKRPHGFGWASELKNRRVPVVFYCTVAFIVWRCTSILLESVVSRQSGIVLRQSLCAGRDIHPTVLNEKMIVCDDGCSPLLTKPAFRVRSALRVMPAPRICCFWPSSGSSPEAPQG